MFMHVLFHYKIQDLTPNINLRQFKSRHLIPCLLGHTFKICLFSHFLLETGIS